MDQVDKDKIIKLSTSEKRLLQYKTLLSWSTGKITGVECIEKILELEKLIFINESIIKAARNETE